MVRYLLNSAVITGPGTYSYHLISKSWAIRWIQEGGWASRIGYPATADHIHNISGTRPGVSREQTVMEPGDEALVVRLKYRVQDPAKKARYEPGPEDWEYGILRKEISQ